jgi:hypothetical protein
MVAYVIGGTLTQKELVYTVLHHCYNQLIPFDKTNIYVHLLPLEGGVYGWCLHNGEDDGEDEFDVEIDITLSTIQLIKTVCHEMVHIKQHIKRELVEDYTTKYQRLWKGIEHTDTKYDDCPWEIEAHLMEETLFKSYRERYEER